MVNKSYPSRILFRAARAPQTSGSSVVSEARAFGRGIGSLPPPGLAARARRA